MPAAVSIRRSDARRVLPQCPPHRFAHVGRTVQAKFEEHRVEPRATRGPTQQALQPDRASRLRVHPGGSSYVCRSPCRGEPLPIHRQQFGRCCERPQALSRLRPVREHDVDRDEQVGRRGSVGAQNVVDHRLHGHPALDAQVRPPFQGHQRRRDDAAIPVNGTAGTTRPRGTTLARREVNLDAVVAWVTAARRRRMACTTTPRTSRSPCSLSAWNRSKNGARVGDAGKTPGPMPRTRPASQTI